MWLTQFISNRLRMRGFGSADVRAVMIVSSDSGERASRREPGESAH